MLSFTLWYSIWVLNSFFSCNSNDKYCRTYPYVINLFKNWVGQYWVKRKHLVHHRVVHLPTRADHQREEIVYRCRRSAHQVPRHHRPFWLRTPSRRRSRPRNQQCRLLARSLHQVTQTLPHPLPHRKGPSRFLPRATTRCTVHRFLDRYWNDQSWCLENTKVLF